MKRLFSAIAATLLAFTGWAQSSIKVEVHNIVETGERFNLVFVVEGEHAPSSFSWEAGSGVTVVWGPQPGTSTSIQIINGKTTRSSQTSYTYILQADQAGTVTIPSATATVNGKQIQSHSVTIQVVDAGGASASQPAPSQNRSGSQQTQSSPANSSAQGDIFMRLSLNRNSVVVGEPVIATLKIYHRTNLVGFEDYTPPTFKSFWNQEVETPTNINFKREQLDGVMYNSAVLRRWILIPQKSGDLSIEPAEVVCLVNEQQIRSGSTIFDDFFGTGYVTTRRRVSTRGTTLHVSPLPSGAPASFGGGVGEYRISAQLSRDSLKTHDAASLILTVQGKGNIALLEAPKISFPPDFEVYDVKTSTNTDKSGTSGSKTFEYPFIPRSPGDFTIGPVEYGYYDVNRRQYAVASAPALSLSVTRSATADTATPANNNTLSVERKGVKNLGEDIRFIRTETNLKSTRNPFLVYSTVWWACVGGLLLLGFGIWLGMRKAAARRADVVGMRGRKATRQALKRLAQARVFLRKNLYTAFYEELHRSLLGFVGDKLSLNMADMDKDNISAVLTGRGVSETVAANFVGLLDACEEARYAPDAGHEAMNEHYEKAVSTITAIDSSMKKTTLHGIGAAVLALLLLPAGLQAQEISQPDSLWKAGVEAYTSGDYVSAAEHWEDLVNAGLASTELYSNLASAYFKNGEIAPAILWWERALRLDPSDRDVRYNLEYARNLTQDKIEEVPEIFFEQWGHALCYLLPSNAWAVLCIVFLAFTVGLALLFLLGSTSGKRRWGFFGGVVALIVTFLCWDFAQWQRTEALR